MTPKEALRKYCVQCTGGKYNEIESCDANKEGWHICVFHPYRLGKGRPSVKLFRKVCLQCMGGHTSFVSECGIFDCPAFPYRMGKNPARKGVGNPSRSKIKR